jgi:hypothetical protein
MTMGQELPSVGSAVEGLFVASPALFALSEAETVGLSSAGPGAFILEQDESLRTREEQRFFDWSIGLLEDAGVVGILKNDYVYQSTTLHGEIHGGGKPYSLTLSRTSVEFDAGQTYDLPIQFTGAAVETEGEDLEAHEVRSAFDSVCRQSALTRGWKDCTSMSSNHSIIFKDLRILYSESEIALDVEADLCQFTVSVHRTSATGVFRYSLTDADAPIVHSPRVADALLSDVAEDAGGDPQPSTILAAMIGAAGLARIDPEWLAAKARRRTHRK